jgi:hypothetical protein
MSTKDGTTSTTTTGTSCIAALPPEVLERVLIYTVQTPRELAACALTCKAFCRVASCPRILWRAIAVHRYGLQVAEASEALYESDYKAMVADDNKQGALPTLTDIKPCYSRNNRPRHFHCCLIIAITWDRLLGHVRIYLDVRGEPDMVPPDGSSVCMNSTGEDHESQVTVLGMWVSELSQAEERPGHYRGFLAFHQNSFMSPGTYMFCYANRYHTMADYQSIVMLDVSPTEGLAGAFIPTTSRTLNGGIQARPTYSTKASPFSTDLPTSERAGWERWVGKAVLERHTRRRLRGRLPEWWV